MLPIQHFSSRVLADIIRRQPTSPARTKFAWQLAVGPALARVTAVDLDGGVLSVRSTDKRWAAEIARARPMVLARLQQLLGPEAVQTVRIER
jgi:predicted nucleic acid-binding Zn ribbon protein